MFNAPCLWNRPRLERYADGALGPRLTRSVQTHLEHCAECVGRVERQLELRSLVKSAFSQGEEPDWTGCWSPRPAPPLPTSRSPPVLDCPQPLSAASFSFARGASSDCGK